MLADFESTRAEGNGTIRVQGRVAVKTGFPSKGDDGEPQDEVKEREEQKVTPPGKGNFESGVREAVRARRKLVTPGQWSAAKWRESDWKKSSENTQFLEAEEAKWARQGLGNDSSKLG